MDHLPVPSNPLYQPLVVPCLCSAAYESSNFQTYPTLRGFNLERLLIGDFLQKPEHETAAFLQDWLYFGVLYETLGKRQDDYIEPHPISKYGCVRTSNLNQHLIDRMTYLNSLLVERNDQVWDIIRKAERCLEQLSYFCCMASSQVDARVRWPLTSEVDISLRVLGQRLASGFIGGLGSFVLKGSILWNLKFPDPPLVIARLMSDNWCPSEISRSLDQYSPATLYYASLLKRTTHMRVHDRCTSRKCYAFLVSETTYQTKHVEPECNCSFLGPDIASVVDIIKAGSVPMLTIDVNRKSNNLQVLVEKYEEGTEYIALSHVWADGLGNPATNTLPSCQLLRLKGILDELRDSSSSLNYLNSARLNAFLRKRRNLSLRFWMDTLCIPVDVTLREMRIKSIRQMKGIYRNSYQVLVLDAELQDANLMDMTEAFMRISLCGWMRRLWTLQEAVLGARLFIKFRDKILDLQKGYNELQEQNKRHQKWDIHRQINTVIGTPRSDALQFFWRMRTMRDSIFPPDEAQFIGHKTTVIMSEDAQKQTMELSKCAGIMSAFEASRYRTTSKVDDVYPCLAGLLGWEAEGAFKVPVEQRLRMLMKTQQILPQGIIFVPGPRSDEHGWRWAVTDFDNEAQGLMQARIEDHTPAFRCADGITVKYAGLVLPENAIIGDQSFVVSSMSVLRKDWRLWWMVMPIGSSQGKCDVSETLAVIFYPPAPEITFHKGIKMAAAFLAITRDEQENIFNVDSRLSCRFLGHGMVQLVGEDHDVGIALQRQDMNLRTVSDKARYIERAWTIQ